MEHPFLPSKRRKPINVSPLLMPIYLPILIVGAAASIPLTELRRMKIERQETQFAKRMHDQRRLLSWKDVEHQIEYREGTFIGEFLSIKGPVRFWWTAENIQQMSPFEASGDKNHEWLDERYVRFFDWCWNRYTNPESVTASLILLSRNERVLLKEKMMNARFVSSCSCGPTKTRRADPSA